MNTVFAIMDTEQPTVQDFQRYQDVLPNDQIHKIMLMTEGQRFYLRLSLGMSSKDLDHYKCHGFEIRALSYELFCKLCERME